MEADLKNAKLIQEDAIFLFMMQKCDQASASDVGTFWKNFT